MCVRVNEREVCDDGENGLFECVLHHFPNGFIIYKNINEIVFIIIPAFAYNFENLGRWNTAEANILATLNRSIRKQTENNMNW